MHANINIDDLYAVNKNFGVYETLDELLEDMHNCLKSGRGPAETLIDSKNDQYSLNIRIVVNDKTKYISLPL